MKVQLTQAAVAQAPQLKPPRRRAPWGIKTIILTMVFVTSMSLLGMYQVWQRYQVYRLGMELSHETLRYRSLLEEHKKLKLELATLKNVDRLVEQAEGRLDMHVPAPQEIVEIR